MRDVLGWRAQEIANLLDLSLAAVNSALHRARQRLATARAAHGLIEHRPLPAPGAQRDPTRGRWRLQPTTASGQPAFGLYQWLPTEAGYSLMGLMLLTLDAVAVADICVFLDPTTRHYWSLPTRL
jgi:RNA polymerase sigma-70 factor (ECF subfamily)